MLNINFHFIWLISSTIKNKNLIFSIRYWWYYLILRTMILLTTFPFSDFLPRRVYSPEASVFGLSKFSSALLVSLPGSSLRKFDTRSMFFLSTEMPLRSVGFQGTIHLPKLHVKVSATKSIPSDTPHVQSRDVSIHESCRYAAPEKKIFSSTSNNLWETQRRFGNDWMRA